jgi:hypothetical protein
MLQKNNTKLIKQSGNKNQTKLFMFNIKYILNNLRMMHGSKKDTILKFWMQLSGKERKELLKTLNSL